MNDILSFCFAVSEEQLFFQHVWSDQEWGCGKKECNSLVSEKPVLLILYITLSQHITLHNTFSGTTECQSENPKAL